MSTKPAADWRLEDIQSLIDNDVEEHTSLEYKSGKLARNSESCKMKLSKSVSAFANAAGGTLLFGVAESKDEGSHPRRPTDIEPVDIAAFSAERLEQSLRGRIHPPIDGVQIEPVPATPDGNGVVYVIVVPKSDTAHQAADHKYYRRYNFMAEAMLDHEVRDVMNRARHPKLSVSFDMGPSAMWQMTLLRAHITNAGPKIAYHIHCRVDLPEQLMAFHERHTVEDDANVGRMKGADGETIFRWTLKNVVRHKSAEGVQVSIEYPPLLPGLSTSSVLAFDPIVREGFVRDIEVPWMINWVIRADSALPRSGTMDLRDIEWRRSKSW